MPTPRTTGMTVIGILNIVFGSLGSLMMVFVVLLGGLFAAGGAQLAGDGTAEGQGVGAMAAAGGGLVMLIGLIGLACWMLLLVSGIGILKVAPWGRKLAIVCGVGGIALQALSLVTGGFDLNLMTIATVGYCGMLLYFCMTPPWKAAFCGQTAYGTPGMPGTSMPNPSQGYEQYRDAA